MAQITRGIRAILSSPFVYSSFQSLMGAHKGRQRFVADFVRPFSGMKILDIGCGPADILGYLPAVDYHGFDISESYIVQARARFGRRGSFHCQQLRQADLADLPLFDLVLGIGLLHHLDDPVAIEVMRLAKQALKADGRFLAVDPCLDAGQNRVARFLVSKDRGQNVRDKTGYEALAGNVFGKARADVRHQAWIPYTHCFMECQ
ncbi:class I SAM-dependent methyltransferase [Candidatus Accumulibacter sp. ACC003]|uniref:class I SAM-dependent methyltransferase n=1 Tax=Candidatus Accumulibacter sp. ACC003 TaxID=2823334 RepID=UPI0025BACF72|nr:class I SAM-dependent methyltransferase [Candidatus Accumulibacter sp. ACC003]